MSHSSGACRRLRSARCSPSRRAAKHRLARTPQERPRRRGAPRRHGSCPSFPRAWGALLSPAARSSRRQVSEWPGPRARRSVLNQN
jgi:hypothetical protein